MQIIRCERIVFKSSLPNAVSGGQYNGLSSGVLDIHASTDWTAPLCECNLKHEQTDMVCLLSDYFMVLSQR